MSRREFEAIHRYVPPGCGRPRAISSKLVYSQHQITFGTLSFRILQVLIGIKSPDEQNHIQKSAKKASWCVLFLFRIRALLQSTGGSSRTVIRACPRARFKMKRGEEDTSLFAWESDASDHYSNLSSRNANNTYFDATTAALQVDGLLDALKYSWRSFVLSTLNLC